MGQLRSQKQERERLARSLRTSGASWVEVAAVLGERYRVNARVALRHAHGWSQNQAADEWNRRWPDELKTFKNFSYWESWPGATGHAPSFDNLGRLAELYECAVSDLLADLPDFRHLDTAVSAGPVVNKKRLVPPGGRTLDGDTGGAARDGRDVREVLSALLVAPEAASLVRRLDEVDVAELVQVTLMWMQRLDPSVRRREVVSKLGSAFALAAVSPVFTLLNPDEYEPVARFARDPDTFDLPVLSYAEGMITTLRRQSDVLGPQRILHSAIGHRELAHQLAQVAPAEYQARAVSAYAELTQFLGWLSFNMSDYPGARHYYEDARGAAHDAQNVELVTYILCAMSQLAKLQGKPRVAIDHAAAAAGWAHQAHSPLAEGYAADVAVQAYVADNQPDKGREALDREYAALQVLDTDEPTASWWYFYGEPFYWSTAAKCALKLHQPEAALRAMDQSLTRADPANLRDRIFRLLFLAKVRIQQAEIQDASSIVADVTRLTATNASPLIVHGVDEVRTLLTPWEGTRHVRELDERLAAYRPAAGNGSTKRTYSG